MPKDKMLSNYLSSTYDKEKNYESIHSKIRTHEIKKKKLLNIAAVFIAIFILGSAGTSLYANRKWEIIYEEFDRRNVVNIHESINSAVANGYEENLDMDYLYQDGIGIKIDSIILTNDHFEMNVNFKFDNYSEIDSKKLDFGYAIYDENNNIYAVNDRLLYGYEYSANYEKLLAKELGLEYNKRKFLPHTLADSISDSGTIFSEDGTIISKLELSSYTGFTKAQKLYIRIFNPGFSYSDSYYTSNQDVQTDYADFKLSNYEWQFEIDIPEKFYNSEPINLALVQEIEDFELKRAELSETGLLLEIDHSFPTISASKNRNTISIIDELGTTYLIHSYSSKNHKIQCILDINKYDFDKKIYLIIDVPELNIYEKVELIEK